MNGALPFEVFRQVGSSATVGTDTDFGGTIIADQSVTLNTGAEMDGRAIALNGAVTLDSNIIRVPSDDDESGNGNGNGVGNGTDPPFNVIPEPGVPSLLALSLLLLIGRRHRRAA